MGSRLCQISTALNSLLRLAFFVNPSSSLFIFSELPTKSSTEVAGTQDASIGFNTPVYSMIVENLLRAAKYADRVGTDDDETNRRRGPQARTASQQRGEAEMTINQAGQHQAIPE